MSVLPGKKLYFIFRSELTGGEADWGDGDFISLALLDEHELSVLKNNFEKIKKENTTKKGIHMVTFTVREATINDFDQMYAYCKLQEV